MALAVDYHGQPSGRVRAVPDRRAIRWYTTIGLIDRPVAHRGRTALYGPRHLLQLVAVKRLQAKGLPLVAIQQELAGATDSQLARVARLPVGARPTVPSGPVPAVAVPDGGDPPAGRVPDRREAAGTPRSAAPAQPPAVAPRVAGGTARRASFWRDRPVAAFTAPAAEAGTDAAEAPEAAEARGRARSPRARHPAGRAARGWGHPAAGAGAGAGRGRPRRDPRRRRAAAGRPPRPRARWKGPDPGRGRGPEPGPARRPRSSSRAGAENEPRREHP